MPRNLSKSLNETYINLTMDEAYDDVSKCAVGAMLGTVEKG
jgi:hypothetical protein